MTRALAVTIAGGVLALAPHHHSHHAKCRKHHRRCHAARHTTHTRPATTGGSQADGAGETKPNPSLNSSPAPVGTTSSPAAPEVGEGVAPPSVAHVQVTAVEYHYTLSRTTVPAGKVVVQFVNDGQDEHNLNLIGAEGPPAGEFAKAPAKAISQQTLEMRPGSYTLFCSLPEHEQKGMKATLVVQ